ncbi:MAG: thioredoxin domain-containing protein [Candidatus Limnocylindrales bacterium]|jgi:protein-disulfide isomerase
MTQSRPTGRPNPAAKNAPPTSRRSARQQRLANREANRALARAGTSGSSGGGLGTLMLWTAIAVVIGAVVIGGAYLLTSKSSNATALGSPIAPHVVTPTNIPVNGRTLGSADAKVTIDAWEDFRCTACFDFTMDVEPKLVDNYIKTGKAKLVYHDLIVIDNGSVTESRDAANAALCANDQGKFWPFHDWLFTNQSPREAPGAFTLDRLVEIGASAGLDKTAFEPCVRNGTHLAEVAAEQGAAPSDASGTPAVYVNGKIVTNATYDNVAAAIDAVLNPASPSPSASAAASATAAPTATATPTVAPTASPS